jgi:hypothetical protein
MSSSVTGPAVMPSGGSEESFEEALCCRVRHGGVSAVARSEGDYGGVARSGVAVCVLAVQA